MNLSGFSTYMLIISFLIFKGLSTLEYLDVLLFHTKNFDGRKIASPHKKYVNVIEFSTQSGDLFLHRFTIFVVRENVEVCGVKCRKANVL